ncbi:UNVERIFIED_CONTAM: hypothetical protein FKN15_007602 [Acipenser sinensis]
MTDGLKKLKKVSNGPSETRGELPKTYPSNDSQTALNSQQRRRVTLGSVPYSRVISQRVMSGPTLRLKRTGSRPLSHGRFGSSEGALKNHSGITHAVSPPPPRRERQAEA